MRTATTLRPARLLACLALSASLAGPPPHGLCDPDGSAGPAAASAAERSPAQQQVVDEHAARQQQFARELEVLAADAATRGIEDAAELARALQAPFARQTLDVDALPEAIGGRVPAGLPPDEFQWRTRLEELRRGYADDLSALAQRAIRQALPSYAFQLLREIAFHHPDDELARKVLGYVRYDNRWTTPYTAYMLRKGQVWHSQFGWLQRDHVARYDAGERFYRGQWMSAERELLLRGAMANGWVIESDHFVVRTNESQSRAVELSLALEDLHRFFMREFSDLFTTPQQMQQLFGSGRPRSATGAGKHEVWYFRTPEDFNEYIATRQPALQGANGIYLPSERCAYFFANPADPQRNVETMYHEVTHQILSESGRSTFPIAEDRDFWIIEGFACYMESFDRTGPRPSVGDPRHTRLYWARQRVVAEEWFIPTAAFTALAKRDFQFATDFPTLQKYYSQATGLTHFLLHYDGGRYRDGGIEYLAQLYSPDKRVRLRPRELPEILGVSYEQLDAQYQEYIAALPAEPPH
jgi:hypothetical protein